MKRFDPDAPLPATPAQLAPPTMAAGGPHAWLFHSKPGDIYGFMEGNALILAVCPLMREAKRILGSLSESGSLQAVFPRAQITPWLKGDKEKPMWTVHMHDVTPADVALATPFIKLPAVKRAAIEKRVTVTQNAASAAHGATHGASAQRTHGAQRTALNAASVADTVAALNATTFAFLLSTSAETVDPATAAAVQRCFVQHLTATQFTGAWRPEWSRWWAAQNTPLANVQRPTSNVQHPMPEAARSAKPISALEALRQLAAR